MPGQGPNPPFIYNNDHRAPWQQGIPPPYVDDRFVGQQIPAMVQGPPPFQGNPSFQGYRGPNWNQNNYNFPQYNNHQPRANWSRGHHHSSGQGSSRSNGSSRGNSSRSSSRSDVDDMCFICKDLLQNCDQLGIHLCDGGQTLTRKTKAENPCEINARLEKVLELIKESLKDKHQDLTEAIEQHVQTRIGEIETIHKHAMDEKTVLENLKKQLESRAADLEKKEKEFREKEKQFEKDMEKFEEDMSKEKEEICRQWQQLRDEISRMEEMHEVQKGRIRLDVGGNTFTTSLLTLIQDPESMLAAMFSGRHNVKVETDGTVFIDRDGTHFRYILNYLRDGCLKTDALPRNRQVLRELRNEAVYYQLHSLLQQIEKLM